jgi:hypothetical protein
MEIVIALLVLVVGVGLLLGPRVARRRRSPARAARPARWNGAAARGVNARANRRSAAVAAPPASTAYAPPADEDAWDDDLEWVDAPPEDDTPAAAPSPAVPANRAPTAAPAAPAAPAGRTWGAAPAATLDAAPAAPARALHTPPDTPPSAPQTSPTTSAPSLGAVPAAPSSALGATPAAPLRAEPAEPTVEAPSPRVPRRSLKAAVAPPAPLDDADSEWSTAIDVPPPRITRGAAAFGAASHPTVTTTKRGNFASRHPIVLVALYATAGIALVVIGVSVISSGSFRASGSPAGERTAEVKVKPSPAPTAVHTPAATPKPTATPAPTPDPAALKAKRERNAWLRDRRNGHNAEGRAVDKARHKARLAERRHKERAQRKQSAPPSTPTPVRSSPAPQPQPQPRPQPRPQPPPCEFCIG